MIEWSDEYSVNVVIIDKEHKDFIDIVNRVTVMKQHNYSQKEVEDILSELVKFAKEHFEMEETYMSTFRYPDYLLHYNEHLNFSLHMIIYNNQVINGEYKIMAELHKYLQEWVVYHMQGTDKKYTKCFNKNGLK
jgi:hemerythrin